MINLNEEKFNGRENAVKVFNNGKAGEVIVKVRSEKKKVEDHPQAPDWKVFWIEADGTEINTAFYYLDPNREGYENKLGIQGRILKDILRALYGEDTALPSAPTYTELLDQCMALVATAGAKEVKAGFTYGSIKYPSKKGYLQLKNTFPFVTGNLDESIAFNWDYDLQHRPKSDSESPSADTKEASTSARPW